jgi:hypothetical protein
MELAVGYGTYIASSKFFAAKALLPSAFRASAIIGDSKYFSRKERRFRGCCNLGMEVQLLSNVLQCSKVACRTG